jgi:hypothetical protein
MGYKLHIILLLGVLLFTALHLVNSQEGFGICSSLLMLGVGILQIMTSIIQIFKKDNNKLIFIIHLILSCLLIMALMSDNTIDLIDFADPAKDIFFITSIAPIIIGGVFVLALFRAKKRTS